MSRIEILNLAGMFSSHPEPELYARRPQSLISRDQSSLLLVLTAGLRHDNRRPYELRACSFELDPHPQADGSATATQGLTSVQASVFGPREPRQRSGAAHDHAVVTVDVGVAPWAQGAFGRGKSRGDK